ncbi:MAG: DNA replication protein DnaD, partial [Eubacterium sp.]|nr:DNA replication protein DnaD [Eubacterium sp.]
MCKLLLDGGSVSSFTSVSNVFIDEYMNKANGEFVKIYLYLLRMVSKVMDAPEEFSTERIADHFGILESDVYRALTYWNDEEVLSLSFNDEGKIEGVLLNNYIQTKAASSRILHQDESVDVNLLAKASGE